MVHLMQRTAFPQQERTELRVEIAVSAVFSVGLRIPGWLARPASIHVNGEAVHTEMWRGYAMIRRTWKSGDVIHLELPQAARTEAIDDLHPETVAVLRGPLVYVALNPATATVQLAGVDSWQPLAESAVIFRAKNAGRDQIFVPLYFVGDESYTTYFQKS